MSNVYIVLGSIAFIIGLILQGIPEGREAGSGLILTLSIALILYGINLKRKVKLSTGVLVLCFLGIVFAVAGITSISPDKPQERIIANTATSEILALILFGLAYYLYTRKAKKINNQNEELMQNIERINSGSLSLEPVATSSIILKEGETAYFEESTYLLETKNKSLGRTGSGGGVSVKVAKGVYVRSGSGASKTVYGDVTTKYPGTFVITNMRLVFLSNQKPFDLPYSKITGFFPQDGCLGIQAGSKSYLVHVTSPQLFIAAINKIKN